MPCPEKFRETLEAFAVEPALVRGIFDGYETLVSSAPKARKAAFFKRALDIMDAQLAPDIVEQILEANACCKSGARLKQSKAFARDHAALSVKEKLAKIAQAPFLRMGVPSLEADNLLRIDAVSYIWEGRYACACSNFNKLKRDYAVSRHYCYCCGGHFKFHYQIMLGVTLKMREVVSSPLDTDGASPCVFLFEIV